jgi:hypothetical protein
MHVSVYGKSVLQFHVVMNQVPRGTFTINREESAKQALAICTSTAASINSSGDIQDLSMSQNLRAANDQRSTVTRLSLESLVEGYLV